VISASTLAALLNARLGAQWTIESAHASSFCDSWIARSKQRSMFLKTVDASDSHVLTAEADGLAALRKTDSIRVPEVVDCWNADDATILAMEWLDFASPDSGFGERFGRALAQLHASHTEGEGAFGWRRDNMLGGTPQSNHWSVARGLEGWIEFLEHQRFGAMRSRLKDARANAELFESVDEVICSLPQFFRDGHVPRPSLIHGDLWSGNWSMQRDGTPVIYDPAVSCSDAEAELAMMELFSGAPHGFWPAYRQIMPIAEGYAWRRDLYQLYHLMNHVVLFGASYVRRTLACARSALAALRT
jgi:fructosamine-3-kinase